MSVLFRTALSLTLLGLFTGCASQPPNPAAPPLPELAVLEDEPVVRASIEVPEVVPTLDPAPWRSTMEGNYGAVAHAASADVATTPIEVTSGA